MAPTAFIPYGGISSTLLLYATTALDLDCGLPAPASVEKTVTTTAGSVCHTKPSLPAMLLSSTARTENEVSAVGLLGGTSYETAPE